MPLGPMRTKAQKQAGMHEVMGEFKRGQLRSGSKTGPRVTSRKQAIAIGLSQTGQSRGYAEGGIVHHDFDQDLPRSQDDAQLVPLTGGLGEGPSPSDISRTVDLLHQNQRQLDEGGDGYQPSNFFRRVDRERPIAPISPIRTPRQRRLRRTQDGDIEELYDPSSLRQRGRGGVRHLDDGGDSGGDSGGGCGGCGGCGGGCGCSGDSCGSGACGGCSCGGGCGVGGIGGFGGSQGAGTGCAGACAGGCSSGSDGGGCGGGSDGSGCAGGCAGGCMGGGLGDAAAAAAAEGQTGQTGGQQGGGLGFGLGGPSGLGLGATGGKGGGPAAAGPDTGTFGNPSAAAYGVAGVSGLSAAGLGLSAGMSPGAIADALTAAGMGPAQAAAYGAYASVGALSGGFYGPGDLSAGMPGTSSFGAEGDAGGGGTNGLGNTAAAIGAAEAAFGGGGRGGGANVGDITAGPATSLSGGWATGGRGGDNPNEGRGGGHTTAASPGAAAAPGAAVGEAAGIGLAGTPSGSTADVSGPASGGQTGGEAAALGGAAAAAADPDVGPAAGEAAPLGGAADPNQGGRSGGRAGQEAAPLGGAAQPAASPAAAPTATPGGFTGQVGDVSVSPATAANTQDLSGGVYGAAPAATTALSSGLASPGNIGGLDFGPGNPFGDPGLGLPATQDIGQPTQSQNQGRGAATLGSQGNVAPGGFESIASMAATNPNTFGAPATSFSNQTGGMYGLNTGTFTGGTQGGGAAASEATGTGGEAAALGGAAPAAAPAADLSPAAGEAAAIGGEPAPGGGRGGGRGAGEAAPMGGAPAPGDRGGGPTPGIGGGLGAAPAPGGGWTSGGWASTGLGEEAAPMGGAPVPGGAPTGGLGPAAGEAAPMGGAAAPAPSESRGGGRGEAAPLGGAIAPGVGPGAWASTGRGEEAAPLGGAPAPAPTGWVSSGRGEEAAPLGGAPAPAAPAAPANTSGFYGGFYGSQAPAAVDLSSVGVGDPGNIGGIDFGPGNPFGDPNYGLPATEDIAQPGQKDQSRAPSGKDQSQAPTSPAPSGTYGAPAPAAGTDPTSGNIGGIDFGPGNPFGDPNYGLPATQDITPTPGTRGGLTEPSFAANVGNFVGGLGGFVGTAQAQAPAPGPSLAAVSDLPASALDQQALGEQGRGGRAAAPAATPSVNVGNVPGLSVSDPYSGFTSDPGGPFGPAGPGAYGLTTDARGNVADLATAGPSPDVAPDARGALQGLTPAANAITNAITGAVQSLGYTGVAHGEEAAPTGDPDIDIAPDIAAPPTDLDPTMAPPAVGPALQGPTPTPGKDIDPGTLDRSGALEENENTKGAQLAAFAHTLDPYVGTQHTAPYGPALDPTVPVSPPPELAPPPVAPPPAPPSPFDINPAPSLHAPTPGQAQLGVTLAGYATPDPGFEAPQSGRGEVSHSPLGAISPSALDYAMNAPSMASPGPALSGGQLGYAVSPDVGAKGSLSPSIGPGIAEGAPSGLGVTSQDVTGEKGFGAVAAPGGPDIGGLSAYSYGENPFGEIAGPYGYYTDNRGGQQIARGGIVRRADGGPLGNNIKRYVDISPSMAAGQVDQNPTIGAGLANIYGNNPEGPGALKWMFSEVGPNRREQNPAGSSDDQSNKQPQQLQITGPNGVATPAPAFAYGGLVDAPGYYATGGLGPAQMRSMGSQAHYSGANVRPAINPPGVHLMSASTPGRTDRIPMRTKAGSYVLPADVVSGLGQGNTQAGAKMWGQALMAAAGPAGAGVMGGGLRRGAAPRAPSMPRMGGMGSVTKGFADGGMMGHNMGPPMEDEYVPIVTAGGEVLIDPEIVLAIGNGSEMMGKRKLADSVLKVRKQTLDHIKSLPRPVA